jgi:hypothetical protein
LSKVDGAAVVKTFCTAIENLSVEDRPVKDGATLVAQRKYLFPELIAEIFIYIAAGTELSDGQSKN